MSTTKTFHRGKEWRKMTIVEAAKKYGISKQSVYQRVTREEI